MTFITLRDVYNSAVHETALHMWKCIILYNGEQAKNLVTEIEDSTSSTSASTIGHGPESVLVLSTFISCIILVSSSSNHTYK